MYERVNRPGRLDVLVERTASTAAPSVRVLCLPGTMSSPVIFHRLSGLLDADAVIAPWLEWPGAHDMQALARSVTALTEEYAPVVLIGHSTGGVIALCAALQAKRDGTLGNIPGMVICDSGANMHGHGDVDTILQQVRTQWNAQLWTAMARRSVHTPLADGLMEELGSYPASLKPRAVCDALRSQRDTDLAPLLGELTDLPVLVVHGCRDRARRLRHARELVELLGNATLAVLDAGHTPCIETPEVFADTVKGLLRRLPELDSDR